MLCCRLLPGLLLLPACSVGGSDLVRHISGEGYAGEIHVDRGAGCGDPVTSVTLFGPGLSTAGPVPAEVSAAEGQPTWLYFPLQTAVGEGRAALRLQGAEAMLPLGARAGEFDVHLALDDGPADPAALSATRQQAEASLRDSAAAWGEGVFRLEDPAAPADARLVGELIFRPDGPAMVAVYDRYWWTGGVVAADRVDDGPDIVLAFVAEPTLQGEEAMLRVNVPTATAVVPADRLPTELDRHLAVVPGAVAADERDAAMQRVRLASIAQEREALDALGSRLAVRALQADGRCAALADQPQSVRDLLAGYDVEIVADAGGCVVDVEPTRRQHRRRVAARVGPDGIIDAASGG